MDTIFAFATGSERSAVSVLRISGPACRRIAEGFGISNLRPRVAQLAWLRLPFRDDVIDQGLVLWFPAPSSFTGEDCLELQVHGGRAVRNVLLDVLTSTRGCRHALPGEFVRRAFAGGKMDLSGAEALADLIDADTELQRTSAISQGRMLYEQASAWRGSLLDTLALLEASIDFADEEDSPADVSEEVRDEIEALHASLERFLATARDGEIVRSGFRVAIAGKPNAGKSSLLNAIAKRDVAIVTEHAGTTRDVIELRADIRGYPIVFLDTAGVRETADPVESVGIARTGEVLRAADLVLWLEGPEEGPDECRKDSVPDELESGKTLLVRTKIDLVAPGESRDGIPVSSRTGEGLDRLFDSVAERAAFRLGGDSSGEFLNGRQRSCIQRAAEALGRLVREGVLGEPEIVAFELRAASRYLQELTGEIGVEDVLGSIFSRFCMGK